MITRRGAAKLPKSPNFCQLPIYTSKQKPVSGPASALKRPDHPISGTSLSHNSSSFGKQLRTKNAKISGSKKQLLPAMTKINQVKKVVTVNPESGSSGAKKSRQLSGISSPRHKLELLRTSNDADMQSCQSTCLDTISVREMEMLPNLHSEMGDVLPKLIKSVTSSRSSQADTEKVTGEKSEFVH